MVLDIELAGKAVRQGAVTAHGRHDEPVRQLHGTDGDGGQTAMCEPFLL